MTGNLAIVTAPPDGPIRLSDTKDFLRVTTTIDDDVIQGLIGTARGYWDGPEPWFGRALLTQTWDYFLPCFPWGADVPEVDELPGIRVPLPPLQSVTSLKYIDGQGAEQTLASTEYVVDTSAVPGRIVPAAGKTWPSTAGTVKVVTVRFVAGYTTITLVPAEIKTWLKQAVLFLYENREAPSIPLAFLWTMARFKVEWKF